MAVLDNPVGGRGGLHNPFRTYSNFVYPRTIDEVFIWALWFWDRNPKYRNALQKVVSYFVAGLNVQQDNTADDVDEDIVRQFEELLTENYNALPLIVAFGVELAAMGNVFVSAERIFTRQLLCPTKGCGWQMPVKQLHKGIDYNWNGRNFTGRCPQCHKDVTYKFKDVKSEDAYGRKIRFVFRDAVDMLIQYNRLTGTYKYYYKMPGQIKNAIKRGDAVYLEDAPKVFLDAAVNDSLIEFYQDKFFSMRTTTLTELDRLYKGWGVPLFMNGFDNFIRLQHLDKFNEAVTMDYIAPVRMLSPQPANLKSGVDDPNRNQPISGHIFRNMMQQSLKQVKENPTTWIISPIPVQYQMLGGEAKQLAPVELMEWYTSQILADMGIPQEFRQTTFQVVAPTMGLRMFERQWVHFAKGLNTFTRWMAEQIAEAHNFEQMSCSLDMTSFVEDDMNKQMTFQLMTGGVISKTNTLKRIGIDYEEDTKQRIKEQKREMELGNEMQEEQENSEMVKSVIPPAAAPGIGQATANIQAMEAAAQGQAPGMPAAPAGAMPPAAPAGGGLPFNQGASEAASIDQMFQQAQQIAGELYTLPEAQRRSQLVQLKNTNPPLHAAVKQMLTDMKQDVASQAVQQSQQPQG
jgi:hypothetical protein